MIKKQNNFNVNYNNLILSAAINYQWNDLKIFVKSLRKVSNDRVIFIVSKDINIETKKKLDSYKIDQYVYSNTRNIKNFYFDVAQRRYGIYEYILKKLKKKPKKNSFN